MAKSDDVVGITTKGTLGNKFQEAGWETHMVGKWHCGARSPANIPYNRGYVLRSCCNTYPFLFFHFNLFFKLFFKTI